MRLNFENAKRLYQQKLRPMLEQSVGIDSDVDRERAKTDREVAAKVQRFENDDRLVKSLLLCALVHGVEALNNMTCMKLAALNHGTVRTSVPNREHHTLANKVRTWAGLVGEIRISEEPTNPTVSIQLSGVDTEGILDAARVYDNPGNRQFQIRQMLFKSLGISEQNELSLTHQFVWRGSKRSCEVLFTNVRGLPDESLRSTEDWKLIIDFPFDAEGHILTYADQTNRAFYEHGTAHYEPTLDDLPNTLVLKEEALPDLKDWNEAVNRVADILGHAVSRLLNASNLATLVAKVGESLAEYMSDCDALPDRLQLVLQHVDVSEGDATKADRVKTAKAVKALLAACDCKEPTALVAAIAKAKLVTSGTSMGRSLKSAKGVLDGLKATRWDLFSAISQIDDIRKSNADLLLDDVRSWLKVDEHALVGGVVAKLAEAEGRAIKLLTPPKQSSVLPVTSPPVMLPKPQPSGPDWRIVHSDAKTRLTEKDLLGAAEELVRKLRENPRYRITILWTLEEAPL